MPKELSDVQEGVASFNAWLKMNKNLKMRIARNRLLRENGRRTRSKSKTIRSKTTKEGKIMSTEAMRDKH